MTELVYGSLFSGYEGLTMGAQAVLPGRTAWVSDIDKGSCKLLAHRFSDVPNLGDISAVDWSTVEPVDVLTGGYPCQPFSQLGKRKGVNDERHLWPYVREAIRHLRPNLTILENVDGHRSLGFDRVLGDLAEDGMHVEWTSVRASDAGAPHDRPRVFIAATADASRLGRNGDDSPRPREWKPARSGSEASPIEWGPYGARVAAWERKLGRSAPRPWETGARGSARLSPRFAEWLMGLPAGWITDVPGLTRNEMLKLCGNGVVPQQAEAALRYLLNVGAVDAA